MNVDVIVWCLEDGLMCQLVLSNADRLALTRVTTRSFTGWDAFIIWLRSYDQPDALLGVSVVRHVVIVPPIHARRLDDIGGGK